ncbi:hypothetical protein VC83_00469 [Pseudogymnoascus destructans]|uniref:Uncharacterized protein n=1 Tax=Pseudogymnoascus destructans TaxID=655981 RepID=A0A177APU8_9PEZI|nr:uncharacterized protein VC83_00469 [Pseudogymnoascus destructans]OAF63421.1 hypothetical protein VC83_00469 [Pseudogymnoascus destructans]
MANEGVQNSIADVLPTMDYLLHHIEAAREATTIPHLAMMMETDWAKLADYYELTEDSPVYSAATVLNPSFKWAYMEKTWEDKTEWIEKAKSQVYWKYLSINEAEETALDKDIALNEEIAHDAGTISDEEIILQEKRDDFKARKFFSYAVEEWKDHALAAYPAWMDRPGMEKSILDKSPKLRDSWVLLAAGAGQDAAVEQLLDRGASIETVYTKVWTNPIWAAGEHGHANARYCLIEELKNGHEKVVELLLRNEAIAKLALDKGADVNHKYDIGWTPLSTARFYKKRDFARLLLDYGADASPEDREWLDADESSD